MDIRKVNEHLSIMRMDRYLTATNSDSGRAIKLYKYNLRLSQSFYPILSFFEVIFRNHLDKKLSVFYNDNDWIINQTNGFMIDSSLSYVRNGRRINNFFLKNAVDKTITKFQNNNITISSGKVIADQNFGFWTVFFELTYYRILLGRPIQIFRGLPSNTNRIDIYNRLDRIRKFRNRISHNEPICFRGNSIDFSEAELVYNDIVDLLNWIDPSLIFFISELNNLNKIIYHAKKV